MPPLRYFASFFCLHHLRHEAAHRLCGFVLLLPRSVGVGAECESSVIVAEHTADGFDVHPILQCQRCEGVSEIMEPDMLRPMMQQIIREEVRKVLEGQDVSKINREMPTEVDLMEEEPLRMDQTMRQNVVDAISAFRRA